MIVRHLPPENFVWSSAPGAIRRTPINSRNDIYLVMGPGHKVIIPTELPVTMEVIIKKLNDRLNMKINHRDIVGYRDLVLKNTTTLTLKFSPYSKDYCGEVDIRIFRPNVLLGLDSIIFNTSLDGLTLN